MVLHRLRRSSFALRAATFGVIGLTLLPGACTKMPLVAPSGTVITLLATTNVLPVNGSTDLIAILVENGTTTTPTTTTPGGTPAPTTTPASAGTPVHNGTVVTFTTTLGRVEPSEAKTSGGQVTVRLMADGRSGVATVTAYSGGASKTLAVNVGAAATARVLVTASPQTLPSNGGTATVAATVQDQQGNPIAGVPVAFSTSAGTLSVTGAVTDSFGNATTMLTTTAEATVTASTGGGATPPSTGTGGGTAGTFTASVTVKLLPKAAVTLKGPTGTVTVGVPTTFTVGVGTTVAATDVTLDFGDGTRTTLGAISQDTTVAHTYRNVGTYTASATAKFVDGSSLTARTDVVVLDWDFNVSCGESPIALGKTSTMAVTVTPTGLSISEYIWNFHDEGEISAGSQVAHTWLSTGTKVVSVTVVPTSAPSKQRLCTVKVI